MNITKILILFISSFILLTSSIKAQEYNPYDSKLPDAASQSITEGALSLPSTTATVLTSQIGVGVCALVGGQTCAAGEVGKSGFFRNYGLIPNIYNANIAMILNPPANTAMAILNFGETLGFLPKNAYAQGVGFNGLAPILKIWTAFRNLAYILLSLILIVIGFMVMFRSKIDPHTVISVQAALPNIIFTLILITFSYAIVGVLIDLSYVVLVIAYTIFRTAGLPPDIATTTIFGIKTGAWNTRDVFLQGNLFQALATSFPNGFSDFGALFEKLTGITTAGTYAIGIIGGGIIALLGAGNPLSLLAGGAVALGAPIIVQFLMALLIFILLAKIFFVFLGAYIQLLIRTILGPLFLVMGAIPGQNALISWIRSILGNLSVFIVAGVMFMLAATFNTAFNDQSQAIWSPPYFPIALTTSNISAFFVIGILMLIPQVANQLRQTIIGQQGGDINMGGAIFGGLTGTTSLAMQAWHMWRSEHHNRSLQEAIQGKNHEQQPPGK